MKLKIAQVIGLNTDQKAAQATSSIREENSFLSVLELVCDDAFTKGRQILSDLEDFYFESEGGVVEKLKATFKEAEEKLSGESEFDLCLAAISGKVLYLIGKGEVEVYLKRDGKLAPLLSVDTPSQLISGFLQNGDRVLLATKSLIAFLNDDLEKSLNLPIEAFEEEVGSRIGGSDLENQGLAALAVEMDEDSMEIDPLAAQETRLKEEIAPEINQEYSGPQVSLFEVVLAKLLGLPKLAGKYFPRSGRGRLIVAVVLIIIIVVGAGFKYKSSRDSEKKAQINQFMQEAKDDFEAAKGLASLSPVEAKNKLDSAIVKINKALSLKSNDQEAQNLKKQMEQDSSSILQQSSVTDFPVFLDIDLIKKNFRATSMSLSVGKLLLLDPDVKTLAVVDLVKKSNEILAGSEQLGDASLASLNGGVAFVYSKDKGILKIDTTNSKLTTVAKTDSEWGKIQDLYAFAGNIYVLDSVKNQIWKYLPTSDGYSAKRIYLTDGTKVDFAGAIKMQIESSVYVLKSGGEILRFTRGDKDNFSFDGLDKGVKDPKSFFVSSDTDNLYVLDSGNSRVLILTKTGSYKGQITGAKFATATDLVVDEKGKKVYLLDGGKIFQVDLK